MIEYFEDFQPLRKYTLDISDKHVFVVLDIHGNYELLKEIVSNIDLEKDYLFILGDISARGKDPLKTLELVMELDKSDHVYVTLGNCDQADYLVLREQHLETFKRHIRKNYIVKDLALLEYNGNIPELTNNELLNLQVTLYNKYTKYFDYLMDLKHCIITDKFVFTHAGIPKDATLEDDNYYVYIHSREFYKKGHNNERIVVCGHIPAVIYRKDSFNDDPLILKDKKIIMMDGGEQIQDGGQINVLEFLNGEYIGFKRYQNYPKVKVINDQISYTHYKGVCWPYLDIEIKEQGNDFTLCLIKDTLELVYVKNEYITYIDGKYKCSDDCPSNFINVKKGEIIYLIKKFTNYSLVKKDGELGFIKNDCIE